MTAIFHPPTIINRYLQDKLPDDSLGQSIPFFPTTPSSIDELTTQYPDGLFAVYDRMFKLRRDAFPHFKYEQLLFYFYKFGTIPKLIETMQHIQHLLDRGDESGEEVNAWLRDQISGTVEVNNIVTGEAEEFHKVTFSGQDFLIPRFHYFRIFQLEESRDIIDFGTARTYAGNKVIIDYCWHESSPI